jgi:hypothetical protein
MVQTLQYASMLTPMQFNLTPVATTETSSSRATGWRLSRNGLNGITIELVSSRVLQGGTTDPTEAEQAMVEAVGPNLLRFRGERGTFGPPTRVMFGQTTLVMDGNDPGRYIRVTRTGSAPLSGSIAIFPLQPIPQVVDLEMEQDKRLMEWITLRLRDFRQDPDELASGFHPTYLPPPPRAPNKPLPATFTDQQLPAGFNPNVPGAPGGGGVGNFDIDRGVTGEPIGNASSRYF